MMYNQIYSITSLKSVICLGGHRLMQGRTIAAPIFRVRLGDVLLADQFISLVIILLDMEYSSCFYLTSPSLIYAGNIGELWILICYKGVQAGNKNLTDIPHLEAPTFFHKLLSNMGDGWREKSTDDELNMCVIRIWLYSCFFYLRSW